MKKLFFAVSVIIATFSFQVNASTLNWDTITGYGPSLGSLQSGQNSPQDLFGKITGLHIETNVLDSWIFTLSEPSKLLISVNSLETNAGSLLYEVTLNKKPLNKSGDKETWSFDSKLTAGMHELIVLGIATSFDRTSGYQVNVSIPTSVVPIPAVGWLFWLSFIGIFRRHANRSERSFRNFRY